MYSQKQKLKCTSQRRFPGNASRREFHMQIEEGLMEELMPDFTEELIEDFIENLMEDFD